MSLNAERIRVQEQIKWHHDELHRIEQMARPYRVAIRDLEKKLRYLNQRIRNKACCSR